jgi:ADP-glucose pyrophosphorylase
MKENNSLLIMAGGASSRMKRSLKNSSVGDEIKRQAEAVHKSLIPLGPNHHPLLFFLIKNAEAAGYQNIYLITSPKNESFHIQIEKWNEHKIFTNINIRFALQHVPESREKPLGTADAIQQALEQYPELIKTTFTVCNGDNLYSTHVLNILRSTRKASHALISYARSGLVFSDERISKFAVMDIDSENYLKNIIEKPDPLDVERYKDASNEIRVSMNIFSFNGAYLYPFLKNCPIHPERNEKELPEAVRLMNGSMPKNIICFPVSEHLPDLTSAEDILKFTEG